MEENRRFSWSDLFIKAILVIIFVLFTVWLLSLSNNKMTNSLDVLTDQIFADNMNKMKEVGKEYFTTERLPEKVGEIKTLSLEKMYEKKLLLELKDKNGKSCSAKNSYISIEKYENEYQMKVYLECGSESDYIVVIMGCYDYCESDICEKVEPEEEEYVKGELEYEYKKTTGGKWTDFGSWSEWSKVSVTETEYRQVETKIEKEEYTYDKVITETEFVKYNATCPSGYEITNDGTKCVKAVYSNEYKNPVCPTVSGYVLIGQNGFECNYSRMTTSTKNPVCPTVSGYTLISQNGFECNYSKTTTVTTDPVCPIKSGYTLVSRNGFTCTYSKTYNVTKYPVCPTVSGYTLVSRNGFECNYSKTTTSTKDPVCPAKSGWNVSRNGFTCTYSKNVTETSQQYVSKTCYTQKVVKPCASCAPVTQNVPYECGYYETVTSTRTVTETGTASCPSGYSKSGDACVSTSTSTTTKSASCPSGYSKSGDVCVSTSTSTVTDTASCPSGYSRTGNTCSNTFTTTISKFASCPSGYSKAGNTCVKISVEKIERTAICPSGFVKDGNKCSKTIKDYVYENIIKTCPSGYNLTSDSSKCYREVEKTIQETGVRDVTYYRYRIREYINGTVDYKWSSSKNDKKLIDAGYKLTGRTRYV